MARSTAVCAVGLAFFLMFATTASASGPTISYSVTGIAGNNGWYRGSASGDNVILHWSVSADATSTNCSPAVPVPGDTAGTTQTCSATNAAPGGGTTTAVTGVLKIDATPPAGVTANVWRGPDFNGWYNHPVTISWSGTDPTSGIAGCSSLTYGGPDNGAATLGGGCTDMAGNSADSTAHLAYDATPPVLSQVRERSTPTADDLVWSSSSAADRVVVQRAVRGSKGSTTVFEGVAGKFSDSTIRDGAEYAYTVQSFDEAGNASNVVSINGLPKVLTLQKTPFAPLAAPNPILRWRGVRRAAYYNVQLYRGSKRIYAAWPRMPQAGLSATWKWSGHRFGLTPGRYHWYVWAGFGPRALARYRIVGGARFVVPRS
jgi:hypothetical protein